MVDLPASALTDAGESMMRGWEEETMLTGTNPDPLAPEPSLTSIVSDPSDPFEAPEGAATDRVLPLIEALIPVGTSRTE